MRYDLLVCGVGGQGIITLSEIIAAASIGNDIKTIVTQEKGLAQRGGSVQAHIRLGDVYSPIMPKGMATGFISLELSETFGYMDFLNDSTVSAVSMSVIASGDLKIGEKSEINNEEVIAKELRSQFNSKIHIVDSQKVVCEIGNPKAENIFMIGLLCGMDFRLQNIISPDDIVTAIRSVVRHKVEDNIAVFYKGMEYGQ